MNEQFIIDKGLQGCTLVCHMQLHRFDYSHILPVTLSWLTNLCVVYFQVAIEIPFTTVQVAIVGVIVYAMVGFE